MQDDFRIPLIGHDAIRETDDLVRSPSEAEISASWQALAGRMDAQEQPTGAPRVHQGRPYGFIRGTGELGNQTLRRWTWSFGVVVACVVAIFTVWVGRSHTSGTTRSYTTGASQEGIVTLDDGTRVTLSPSTTLQLIGFSKQARTVAVNGQAYFEVARAAGAPFEVRSGPVTTQVLGTAFLVKYGPHSSHVRVAVEEGKVRVISVSHMISDFTVTAGQVGEVTDSSTVVTAVDDSTPGMEWLRGKLVFHHMSVATVLQTLSRWYGYQFRCADSTLPGRPVTISLSVRSSVSALATLEQVLDVNLAMTGDTVALVPHTVQRGGGTPRVRSYDTWTPTREVGR